jgi:hypothetical protein
MNEGLIRAMTAQGRCRPAKFVRIIQRNLARTPRLPLQPVPRKGVFDG